jgi:hypothetical protein
MAFAYLLAIDEHVKISNKIKYKYSILSNDIYKK